MIRVLLCDDHTVVRIGLERLVSTFDGITVAATASNGSEAVALLRDDIADVVLMDLAMPILDGVEATRQIMAANAAMRVVILTSFSDRHRIHGALAAGAIGYLLKDASPDELERAIRAAARGEAPIAPKAALALLPTSEATAPISSEESGSVSTAISPASTSPASAATTPNPAPSLSARELEALALVAKGLANKQIARQLGIAETTVKAHLTSIFRTIHAENRTQAARWYERHVEGARS